MCWANTIFTRGLYFNIFLPLSPGIIKVFSIDPFKVFKAFQKLKEVKHPANSDSLQ